MHKIILLIFWKLLTLTVQNDTLWLECSKYFSYRLYSFKKNCLATLNILLSDWRPLYWTDPATSKNRNEREEGSGTKVNRA